MNLNFRKLSLVMVFFALSVFAFAQGQMQNLPLEKGVRSGVLPNGMKYYIKKNAKPANTADFYIAHAVGSLQETDAQHGLAHFLEHMAFNGTKHYPGKNLISYIESLGGAFGRNVNAYTYYDETVYNLTEIPLARETVIDSCLLILHDWSSYISLKGKEIDSERGVIHEEWRTRMAGERRMGIDANKILYKDSKYGKRTVIGDLEVIDKFDHKEIRDLYKDWYRPDLQGVIVVGDFDVDKMEKKIKEILGRIPKRENAKERIVHPVPENVEPKVAIITDPEAKNTKVSFTIKLQRPPKQMRNSAPMFVDQIMRGIYSMMIRDRFEEIVQKPNAPFIIGFSRISNVFLPIDGFSFGALAKDNGTKAAFEAVLKESERVKRYGFTATEFERAKEKLLKALEAENNEKSKQKHEYFVEPLIRHFLENTPAMGIEAEYNMCKQMLPMIPVDKFNMWLKQMFVDNNVLITVTGPKKEGVSYPTEKELIDLYKSAKDIKVKAYVDNVITEPLLKDKPKGSKVVKEEQNKDYGTTIWTLANGVKVVLKETNFKDDEILMSAFAHGGKSLLKSNELISAEMATTLSGVSGLAKFDQMSLKKVLAGKIANASPYIGNYSRGFSGNSSVKDFETMLQLVYLYTTNPRFDQEAFTSILQRYKDYLKNNSADPTANFKDTVKMVMANYSERRPLFNAAAIDKVVFKDAKNIYNKFITDAKGITFIFVGNVNKAKVKPLIESYLGALPSKKELKFKDDKVRFPKKDIDKTLALKMKTEKTTIRTSLTKDIKYTLKDEVYGNVLSQVLDLRYTQSIREESGGTYGVGVWSQVSNKPKGEFALNIQFDTDPAKAKDLLAIVYKEIDKIKKNGPTKEDLTKTKQNLLKVLEKNQKENKYWLNVINTKYYLGIDQVKGDAMKKIIEGMTVKSCKKVFKHLLKGTHTVKVIMNPKK